MKLKPLLLAFCGILLSGITHAREIINLNRDWQFFREAIMNRTLQDIDLPHTWNSDISKTGNSFFYGTGNYLKEIRVPAQWDGKKVFIRFYGVSNTATLFINGKYVGEHKGGYTGFTFNITPFLNFGMSNSILVVANNTRRTDVMPINGDITVYGGIYRDVELIVTDSNHISLSDYGSDGVYLIQKEVSQDEASVEAVIEMEGTPGGNLNVQLQLFENNSPILSQTEQVKISQNGKGSLSIPFTVTQPRLWDGTNDPFLYNVTVSVVEKEIIMDQITVPLGLRYFSIDRDKGFMLNGKPYPLNGVTLHHDRSGVGNALTRLQQQEDIDLINEIGANAVRMINTPHDQYTYELCDISGLIVWSDFPFISNEYRGGKGYINSENFRKNGERQLLEMIRQLYNHPSIVFWGLFSKLSTNGDNPLEYIKYLNDLAHKESPDRLTTASSNEDGDINMITDAIGWPQYFGWNSGNIEDFILWANQFKDGWKELKPAVSEYGAGGNILHQRNQLAQPQNSSSIHPENWQTHFHEQYYEMLKTYPFLWGTFINSMFDYACSDNSTEGSPHISDMGLVSFDRHTKKDAFYFYKANWNDIDPFIHITEKRNIFRNTVNQSIKVYTNLDRAELIVNNFSYGIKEQKDGIIIWDNIKLLEGRNRIDVVSGLYNDFVELQVYDNLLAQ